MKEEKPNKEISNLQQLLADIFVSYMHTYKFHWNLVGVNFMSIHLLYQKIYELLYENVDIIAERIRAKGGYAPCSLSEYADSTKIEEYGDQAFTVQNTTKALLAYLEVILSDIDDCYSTSDSTTSSILNVLQEELEKKTWFLRSQLE